ncbi:hypothetical protein Y032_0140g2198 [Ancylostoma ceylanicum]|nr:hypothetical protein Y032_0140g2198 [Ancylostoma ceylanicum]
MSFWSQQGLPRESSREDNEENIASAPQLTRVDIVPDLGKGAHIGSISGLNFSSQGSQFSASLKPFKWIFETRPAPPSFLAQEPI